MAESKCPLPTQDIKTNLANRAKAIDVAHYGPANPKEPNEEYWTAKAKIFGGSVKEAKTMRCGNCAGFNQTTKLTDCISKGIGSDAQEVEQAGDLGYCEIFDFKCASLRTCDAWIVGGPITDKTNFEQLKADLIALKEQGATLLYDPSQARDEAGKWSGSGSKIVAYHGTTKEAKDAIEKHGYDVEKSIDGGMWLTTNKDAITKGEVGASGKGDIVERIIDESSLKLGGWKEYDKYVMDQLIGWGFDGLKLPDKDGVAYKIFFPEKLAKVIEKSPLKKFETNFYDPSQKRDEAGKWTSEGFVSSVESPKEISQRIISRIQKENPEIDIEDGKFKKAVESLGENLKDAKIKTKYGNLTPKQISNWIKSEDGQKLIGAVDKTLKVAGAGAIGALKGIRNDQADILTNAIFAPQVLPFIATRSAIHGIISNATREYQSIKKGQEIKSAVEKQVGVKPMEASINPTDLQEDINIADVADYLTDVLRVSILKYINKKKEFQVVTFYDPSQARDESGKWTSSSGGAKGEILISPNIKENMTYEEAVKMTDSASHASAVSLAKDVVSNQNMDAKFETGVGDWEDGAENSIKIDVEGAKDFDQIGYTASKLGMLLKQKAVVAFEEKPDGEDTLHRITTKMGMDQVRKVLSDNGITFRTMVGDRQKTNVTILDKGSQLTSNIENVLGVINGTSNATRGFGEFIGGDTRIQGQKAYRDRISNYEKQFPHRVRHKLQKGQGRNYYRSYQPIDFYDPSQKRDESGKWTGGGGIDEATGLNKNQDGTVTVYHHTSKKNAEEISKTGKLKSAGEPDVYVTTQKSPDTGYGDTSIEIRIDPSKLILDDEFPSGRKDYRINTEKQSGKVSVTTNFYDPSQKRDDSGKWTGSGGSSGATPTPKWAQDNPAEASKKTGQSTVLYHGTSADVLKDIRKDGLKPSKSGVWGGGKVYSTDSLDLAMEYGVLRSGSSPKIGGKQLIGIISVLADGFKSVADNIPTTKAQKMGKTGLNAVSKIFTKDGVVPPSAIKLMQIFEVDTIRKYVYENGPKPKPLATKQLADGSKLIYVPIVIQLPDDGSEGFQFDEAVAIESFVFQYNGKVIEFYDPNQPRDENGRWSGKGGGGGKGKVKGKSTKAKKESETSTTSDEIDQMVQKLKAEPKAKMAMDKMAKLQKEVAKAEGSENAPVTHWSLRDPKRYIQKKDLIETFNSPTPEHEKWKQAVIDSELNPKAQSTNPIAVILMGSPASGKTTTGRPFAEKILNGKETTKIDPDSVKGKSKGFEGWNAGAFHEESALISEKVVFPRAVGNNHNLLIDITGKNSNKVADMAKLLKSVGYTIGLVHVDVDDKVALDRASKRFNKPNGRYVPYDYIRGSAEQARKTWTKLTSEGIADIGYSIDGNADRSQGTAPVKATHGNLFD